MGFQIVLLRILDLESNTTVNEHLAILIREDHETSIYVAVTIS